MTIFADFRDPNRVPKMPLKNPGLKCKKTARYLLTWKMHEMGALVFFAAKLRRWWRFFHDWLRVWFGRKVHFYWWKLSCYRFVETTKKACSCWRLLSQLPIRLEDKETNLHENKLASSVVDIKLFCNFYFLSFQLHGLFLFIFLQFSTASFFCLGNGSLIRKACSKKHQQRWTTFIFIRRAAGI